LSYTAVRGRLIAGLLVALAAGYGVAVAQPRSSAMRSEPTADPDHHEPTGQAQPESAAPEQEQPYSTDYRTRCDRPQDREEADLCQQWRSAQAAEKTAALAGRQFWVSIIESSALLVSIFFTAWAAVAASRAAGAADRAVDAAAKANELNWKAHIADQRPWVGHTRLVTRKVFGPSGEDVTAIELMLEWVNAGNSPAIKLSMWDRCTVGPPQTTASKSRT
jgi:hypothetical protein